MSARERFEAWWRDIDATAIPCDDNFIRVAWAAWQASRAAALDEAARAMHHELRSMLSRGEAHDIILALKEQA